MEVLAFSECLHVIWMYELFSCMLDSLNHINIKDFKRNKEEEKKNDIMQKIGKLISVKFNWSQAYNTWT